MKAGTASLVACILAEACLVKLSLDDTHCHCAMALSATSPRLPPEDVARVLGCRMGAEECRDVSIQHSQHIHLGQWARQKGVSPSIQIRLWHAGILRVDTGTPWGSARNGAQAFRAARQPNSGYVARRVQAESLHYLPASRDDGLFRREGNIAKDIQVRVCLVRISDWWKLIRQLGQPFVRGNTEVEAHSCERVQDTFGL